jgi:4-hydroxy-tetrahydrodipicolinate reductase
MQTVSPIPVAVLGASGRMGRAILRLLADDAALSPVAAVDVAGGEASVPFFPTLADALAATSPAVVIDFSAPSSVASTVEALAPTSVRWVLGTTGLDEASMAAVRTLAASRPVLQATNMSLGVTLLAALVERAATALRGRGYDCEITERHHRLKKDAPSGTALTLGEAAARGLGLDLAASRRDGRSGLVGARSADEIGFHAVRGGDILGDHTVLFAAEGEMLELSHRLTSRDTLARGALVAARWLAGVGSPGLYAMADALGLGNAGRTA